MYAKGKRRRLFSDSGCWMLTTPIEVEQCLGELS